MTSNFPSRYQEVPIYHCVNKGPYCDLQFPITLSGGLNSSLRHHGAPIGSSKGPKFPKYTVRYVLIKKCRILKSYRGKRVQSLRRGVYGGGVEGIRLWSMGRGPEGSVVHRPLTPSQGPSLFSGPQQKIRPPTKKKKKKGKVVQATTISNLGQRGPVA